MFCSELGITPTTSNILINRGITQKDEAASFLAPSLDDLIEPFMLGDMGAVVSRVKDAFLKKEKILIYGDYDADGITATALLVQFFRKLGGDTQFYIPERQEEGYGISVQALEKIRAMGVKLIITVDCGISSVPEVEAASRMGMDVIITDHHEPPDELPRARAILNPCIKGSGYPFTGLAGVGVALKLAQGVLAGLEGGEKAGPGIDGRLMEYLDLVALGTVADVVPLKGENRILVSHGLKLLKDSVRPGIKKLKEVAMINGGRVNSGTVGFQMAPRLNASGRMGRAEVGVKLLITDDPEEAGRIALELDTMNRERQKIEEVILEDARSMILSEPDADLGAIVLSSDRWHQGVIGIVASKLVEEFFRPTVLISMNNCCGRGSARSIPAFHLYNGLESMSGLLEGFGGHKYAAGLSIRREILEPFKRQFDDLVRMRLTPEDFVPSLRIDGELSLGELDWGLYGEITSLAPFGAGNPEPVLQASGVTVLYPKVVGKNHVRMKVRQGGCVMGSIGFNMGDLYQRLAMCGGPVDTAFCLDMNEWQGEKRLQLNLKDVHFRDAPV
jgi:single-stranded-DNA-specific exonuclease